MPLFSEGCVVCRSAVIGRSHFERSPTRFIERTQIQNRTMEYGCKSVAVRGRCLHRPGHGGAPAGQDRGQVTNSSSASGHVTQHRPPIGQVRANRHRRQQHRGGEGRDPERGSGGGRHDPRVREPGGGGGAGGQPQDGQQQRGGGRGEGGQGDRPLVRLCPHRRPASDLQLH